MLSIINFLLFLSRINILSFDGYSDPTTWIFLSAGIMKLLLNVVLIKLSSFISPKLIESNISSNFSFSSFSFSLYSFSFSSFSSYSFSFSSFSLNSFSMNCSSSNSSSSVSLLSSWNIIICFFLLPLSLRAIGIVIDIVVIATIPATITTIYIGLKATGFTVFKAIFSPFF